MGWLAQHLLRSQELPLEGGVSLQCWDKHGGTAALPHNFTRVVYVAQCITFHKHVHVDVRVCRCTLIRMYNHIDLHDMCVCVCICII